MIKLLIFFTFAITVSFLCSIWEAVLLSITPSYISRQQAENPKLGKRLKEYKNDIDRPLSAILTLNTIAHTVGAIIVGAQAGKVFGNDNVDIIGFQLSYESIIAGVMTLAILFLSEIIPKTIGANNWKVLTPFTVKSLDVLIFVLKPFIWVSLLITKFFKGNDVESVLSRADYRAMTSLGEESGAIATEESKIINNLLDFKSVKVNEIMTPRTVVFMMDEKTTVQDYYKQNKNFHFSRVPIFKENRDHVSGFVLKDEILHTMIESEGKGNLESLKRPIHLVSGNLNLTDFFKEMSEGNHQIAAVQDQYGSMTGIVTLEDVLETILGYEIIDETDNVSDLQAYAKMKWEARAKEMQEQIKDQT